MIKFYPQIKRFKIGHLTGKKAIITGGNRGIGMAIALAYAHQGADCVITYHTRKEKAEAVVHEIERLGRRALAVQVDITVAADRKRLVEESQKFLGEIHIYPTPMSFRFSPNLKVSFPPARSQRRSQIFQAGIQY